MSETKQKGDIAMLAVSLEIQKQNLIVLNPISDYLPYDLVAHNIKNNIFYRIQVKYIGNINNYCIRNVRCTNSRKRTKVNYTVYDFDYYGLYLADKNVVIFAPFEFGGKKIRTEQPNIDVDFYWYEDFLVLPNNKIYTVKHINKKADYIPRKIIQKIEWPSKEELEKLVWSKPVRDISINLGVSDSAVHKMCKRMNIPKPPKGYWLRKI